MLGTFGRPLLYVIGGCVHVFMFACHSDSLASTAKFELSGCPGGRTQGGDTRCLSATESRQLVRGAAQAVAGRVG